MIKSKFKNLKKRKKDENILIHVREIMHEIAFN